MLDKLLFDGYYTIMESPFAADYNGLRDAYAASRMSDHSTQVGAVCGVAYGFNKSLDRRNPDVRIHAETMALLMNARNGVSTQGRTMYAPWAACGDCAMHIITAGVARVVVHHERMQRTPPHWQGCVEDGLHMLQQHNVVVDAVSQELGEKCLIGGEEVSL